MPTKQIVLVALSTAAVIAVVWIVSTKTEVALNESGTELVSISFFGRAKAAPPVATDLSAQRRAP